MLNNLLANFYERDLRKLVDEVNLFKSEDDLWRTAGSVSNSAGNLVLHIIGGMNHHIGTQLARNGYIRNRDQEFALKGVEKKMLIRELEDLILLSTKTLNTLTPAAMEADYPLIFDDANRPVSYVVTQLVLHLNYHLGQVNYIRRLLE